LQLVAQLTGLPTERVAEAFGALARAEVLRHEYPLAFVHPLVHDAVYGDIPLGTREMQHEQAARLLADTGAAAEQIAAHLLKIPGRGDEATVQVLMAAAARSAARGAPDGAATYLKRALDEPASARLEPQVYLELGRVETMTDVPAAVDHLTAAYQRLTDLRERAHAAVMLGRVELFAGTRGHSREIAESIIDEVAAGYDDERQWLQAISRISSHMHVLGPPAEAAPEISGGGPGARSLAATLAWETTLTGTDRQRAIDLAHFGLADGVLDEVDQAFMGAVARNVLEVAEAAPPDQWDDALAKAYSKGSLFAVLGAQVWGGYAHWNRGELEEAQQWLRNCTEQTDLWGGHQIGQTYTDAFMVEVLVDLGDLAGAQALLDSDPDYWRLVSEGHVLVLTAKARVLLHRGLLDQALTVLDRVRELSDPIENPAWRSWETSRAVVLGAAGRVDEALELVRPSLLHARRWATTRGEGKMLRIVGTLLGDRGVDELRASVDVLESGPAALELAKALAALADRLAVNRSGAPSMEAVETMRRAYLLAAGCGAAGLQARVAASLVHHGQEVPAPPRRTGLTTTERDIARMAVAGAFDQEIAQALFITTSTVRQTLDGVRQRLGATTTDQLRDLLTAR
jgi:DNA-binding CsgD family transcriptional regulator/tetratricopeptide (TPR) repeat protein